MIATLLLTAAIAWPKEPSGFRGVPFNADQRTARATIPVKCVSSLKCVQADYLLGAVHTTAELFFHDGRFGQAHLTFAAKDHDYLRNIFVESYGEPMSVENGSLIWRGNRAVVVLGDTYALITERAWSDELDRLAAAQTRAAASELH